MSNHGPDAAIESIRKHRQAFSHGVFSARSMIDYGTEGGVPMEPLNTNIESDLVHAGWYLPRVKMNNQLYQATANRLAMQLIVSVGNTYENKIDSNWQDSKHPEIQFLRHIRNAAAHDNRLAYESPKDPRSNTEWNDFKLTRDMEGQQVFPDVSEMITYTETVEYENGFFEAGDALSLTTDILTMLVEWSDQYSLSDIRHSPRPSHS